MATALALLVFPLTRVCRKPALSHCLWILVLVKLVTPPIVSVPLPVSWVPGTGQEHLDPAALLPPIEVPRQPSHSTAATAFYWWHPVVWWARREIQLAEEACCDSWVVSEMPDRRETYAAALVEAVRFLSHPPSLLPLPTSGSSFVAMKERVTTIMRANDQGQAPYRLEAINSSLDQAEGEAPWPSSYHPGGVHVVFADGHVNFLSENV
ncbi:MAG: M56 family metallopeptidase, partial [Planctomycetota bacterium]